MCVCAVYVWCVCVMCGDICVMVCVVCVCECVDAYV